ncbi:hypothetical protein [Jatrophihabitans lederbergiae]|uniref:Uncharacterized protein n=1 Tax=Jatrophihabitans lederbergiae TaxID=3075547 RepID=A0ABU2JCM4_9ACTN|nr:hypothetical protein [Jatrophihabitans sp. DSM 44399]MDT0262737.1 hypothetical protein [Jatrophihabitans sp. DSM 44399]
MLVFEGLSEVLGFGEVLGVGIVGDEVLGFGEVLSVGIVGDEVLGFAVAAAGDEVRTLELDGATLVAALVAVRMVAGALVAVRMVAGALVAVRMVAGALVVVGATELGTAVVPAVLSAGDAVVEDPVQPATDVQSSTPVTVNSQRRFSIPGTKGSITTSPDRCASCRVRRSGSRGPATASAGRRDGATQTVREDGRLAAWTRWRRCGTGPGRPRLRRRPKSWW